MTPTETTAVLRLFGLTSLSEATRENWPWWGVDWDTFRETPRMPDFPMHEACAVGLAHKMAATVTFFGDHCIVEYDWSDDGDSRRVLNGPTLGAALLAALVASTEETA